jgi:hypothetical protein
MITLILADDVVLDAAQSEAVSLQAGVWITPTGHYPISAGVTGIAVAPALPPVALARLRWVDGALVVLDPPPVVRVVPDDISRLQLVLGLAAEGLITADEAEVFGPGNAIPSAFLTEVNKLPSNQRAPARIQLATFATAHRDDPIVELLRTSRNISQAEMDALWRGWGASQ